MKIVLSKEGVPVRLTPERMEHIARRHPEMAEQEEKILGTVADPDLIQEGDGGTKIALKHYRSTPLTEKFCAVIYREVSNMDGFVVTAYFCARYASQRRTLWKR
jgi:hypothetical protein